jgi:hypothetical protein
MAQLKLAPDFAAASRHRMCKGGLEKETEAIFDVLQRIEKGGWNIKLARIFKKYSPK